MSSTSESPDSGRLDAFGWSAALNAAFAPFRADGLEPARVAVAFGATFRVVARDGEMLADLAGRLRHQAEGRRDLPAVGDWIALKRSTIEGGRSSIQAILPRKSVFSRKVAGETTVEQIVAANVDVAFLMNALDHDFNPRRLERYLAMTWESGARPVILLNKADVAEQLDDKVHEMTGVAIGVPVHVISARDGRGVDALAPYLEQGQTIAVLGSSGVGKSTLINRLLGEDRLRTQEVRASDSRGRHTTTHRELVPLPGGAVLVDTPGMRELQLWSAESGLVEAFDDIAALAADCFFADCAHDTEPRCAVKAAVAEGRLAAERLENYHKLGREQAMLAARQDGLAQQMAKKRLRTQFRAFRKQAQARAKDRS
jgi:ribosome biogenesis GTPase / thiamine phosphate phosphatase